MTTHAVASPHSKPGWCRHLIDMKAIPSKVDKDNIYAKLAAVCLGEGMSLIKMPPEWSRSFLKVPSKTQARVMAKCVEESKTATMHVKSEPFAAIVIGEQKRGLQKDPELYILVNGGTGADTDGIKNILETQTEASDIVCDLIEQSKQAVIDSLAARVYLACSIAMECCGATQGLTKEVIHNNMVCDSCHTRCDSKGKAGLEITSRCISGTNTWGNVIVIGNVAEHGVDVATPSNTTILQSVFPDLTYMSVSTDEEVDSNADTSSQLVANAIAAVKHPFNDCFSRWHLSEDSIQWQDEGVINIHSFFDKNDISEMTIINHYNIACMAISNSNPEDHELKMSIQKKQTSDLCVKPDENLLNLMMKANGGLSVEFAAAWASQRMEAKQLQMHLNGNQISMLQSYIQTKHSEAVRLITQKD